MPRGSYQYEDWITARSQLPCNRSPKRTNALRSVPTVKGNVRWVRRRRRNLVLTQLRLQHSIIWCRMHVEEV